MKFLVPLMIGVLALTACDKDDDNIRVPDEFQNAFNALYPDVTRVSWEKERNYYVADFWHPEMNVEAEAWFDGTARWQLTVTEIRYNQLPQTVRTTHEGGEYGSWRIDDVDMVERTAMETVYVIEVENGNLEYDLFYTADGTLVKASPDNSNNNPSNYIPTETSSSIKEFISLKYPGARIVEIDREGALIEVDIIDSGVHREVVFSSGSNWEYTETEIRRTNVPSTIMDAFNNSEYNRYRIDDIDHYDTPGGEFYIFELDVEPHDIHIKIYPDGTVERR
jgi:Protein of unknown function (DUF2874).